MIGLRARHEALPVKKPPTQHVLHQNPRCQTRQHDPRRRDYAALYAGLVGSEAPINSLARIRYVVFESYYVVTNLRRDGTVSQLVGDEKKVLAPIKMMIRHIAKAVPRPDPIWRAGSLLTHRNVMGVHQPDRMGHGNVGVTSGDTRPALSWPD